MEIFGCTGLFGTAFFLLLKLRYVLSVEKLIGKITSLVEKL